MPDEARPQPRPLANSGGRQMIQIDLRRGRTRTLPDQAALRDAVLGASKKNKQAGVRVLSPKG